MVFALHPGTVRSGLLESYRSNPQMATFLDGLPADAYTPPERAGEAVVRWKGKALAYLFDFGDEWRLLLKVADRWGQETTRTRCWSRRSRLARGGPTSRAAPAQVGRGAGFS